VSREPPTGELARRWDKTYATRDADRLSWYQLKAAMSLELVDVLGVEPDAAIIDIGGGASPLATQLVAGGFCDVSVLDISAEALAEARRRAGVGAPIHLLHADLLVWRPERRYDVWHDRALLHFLVASADRDRYLETLFAALRRHGSVIIGAFAPDAPDRCSGLPVRRYSAPELAAFLGGGFELIATRREEHVTPAGAIQPFTWIASRKRR
jgi:trans-aconitate methyltransferase